MKVQPSCPLGWVLSLFFWPPGNQEIYMISCSQDKREDNKSISWSQGLSEDLIWENYWVEYRIQGPFLTCTGSRYCGSGGACATQSLGDSWGWEERLVKFSGFSLTDEALSGSLAQLFPAVPLSLLFIPLCIKCSQHLVTREMQIQTIFRFHLIPVRMTKINKINVSSCWQGYGEIHC